MSIALRLVRLARREDLRRSSEQLPGWSLRASELRSKLASGCSPSTFSLFELQSDLSAKVLLRSLRASWAQLSQDGAQGRLAKGERMVEGRQIGLASPTRRSTAGIIFCSHITHLQCLSESHSPRFRTFWQSNQPEASTSESIVNPKVLPVLFCKCLLQAYTLLRGTSRLQGGPA